MSKKKIDALMSAVYSSAEEKARREIAEIDAATESALREYEADLRRSLKASSRRIAAREAAKAAEIAARKESDLRSSLYRRRSEITEEVFRAVRERVEKFRETPDYAEMLTRDAAAVAKAMEARDGAEILIGRADESLSDAVAAAGGLPVRVTDEIKLGGLIGVCDEMECDCTFDSRFKDAQADFAENSGLSVV